MKTSVPRLKAERRELANGLVVLLSENHALPAVSVNAVVKAGERFVPDELAGLGSLAGELLDEGTEARSSQEIAEAVEATGGELASSGGYATTQLSATLLAGDLALGLELVADMLRRPSFPEDRVALEVSRRLAEIRARQDEPRLLASDAFNEIVFAGTPQRRPLAGYAETVPRVTRADLAAYHRRFFVPNNTLLAIAGDFDAATVGVEVEQLFGGWARDPAFRAPAVPAPRMQTAPATRLIRKEKEQVNIFLGHLGIARTDPDYHAVRLLDVILGDSPGLTSRIPRVLRDEQGLAYAVYCHAARGAGLDPGRFAAYIGTSPGNQARAVAGLREQIGLIAAAAPTQDEVRGARDYLTGSFVFEFETNAQIAQFLVSAETYGLGFDYPQRFVAEVGRLTPGDVLRAARRHISPDRLTLVVVGPV